MELTKEDLEALNQSAIEVIEQPKLAARLDRARLLQLTKELHPDAEDFDDDEIIAVLRLYGQGTNVEMLIGAGRHLAQSKERRSNGNIAPNDPQKLIEKGMGNPLIGKKP